MTGEDAVADADIAAEDVEMELATAVGLFVLSDANTHEAATTAGVTRWELETAMERAGLAETFDIDQESDVSDTIDDLLDDGTSETDT